MKQNQTKQPPCKNNIKIKSRIINRFTQWQSQMMVLSYFFNGWSPLYAFTQYPKNLHYPLDEASEMYTFSIAEMSVLIWRQ